MIFNSMYISFGLKEPIRLVKQQGANLCHAALCCLMVTKIVIKQKINKFFTMLYNMFKKVYANWFQQEKMVKINRIARFGCF